MISVEPLRLAGGATSIPTDFLETKPFAPTRNPGDAPSESPQSQVSAATARPINSPRGNEPWSLVRHKPSMATRYDMEPSASEFGDSMLLS